MLESPLRRDPESARVADVQQPGGRGGQATAIVAAALHGGILSPGARGRVYRSTPSPSGHAFPPAVVTPTPAESVPREIGLAPASLKHNCASRREVTNVNNLEIHEEC